MRQDLLRIERVLCIRHKYFVGLRVGGLPHPIAWEVSGRDAIFEMIKFKI